MLELLACPAPVTIQDLGRPGYRHLGVPLSGALDPLALRLANALLGNAANAAALELRLLGPQLQAKRRLRLALALVDGRIHRADGSSEILPAWRSATLLHGDRLQVGALPTGVAYLALGGGVDVPRVLGSRSTYLRAALGGVHGRALQVGDHLQLGEAAPAASEWQVDAAPLYAPGAAIRVIPGPQAAHFTAAALAAFYSSEFRVGQDTDRMGLRLHGPALCHSELGADIVSDAVTPGAIQVPGDGSPIVLLADCQTVGGYAKIATVIQADLPRLGHLQSGATLRFAAVTQEQALAALRQQEAALAAALAAMVPWRGEGGIDLDALYAENLITGVVHAE